MYQLSLNIVNTFSMLTSTKSYVTVIELMLSGMFIKDCTREQRGRGTHVKMSGQVKLPHNFPDFLCDSKKQELFALLTSNVAIFK